MNEVEEAFDDLFMTVCNELRIPQLVDWLLIKLLTAMTFYWNYKLQQ